MSDDEIILRLTRELYDLKAKLHVIRNCNDVIYDITYDHDCLDSVERKVVLHHSIAIANELDTGIDYD